MSNYINFRSITTETDNTNLIVSDNTNLTVSYFTGENVSL